MTGDGKKQSDVWVPTTLYRHQYPAVEIYGTVDEPVVIEFSVGTLHDPGGLLLKTLGRIVQVSGFDIRFGRARLVLSPCPKGMVAETEVIQQETNDGKATKAN